MVGDEEGQLEGLLLVEARVAEAGVVGGQVVLVEALAAAEALGDGVAGELEVDAAEVAPLLVVDAQGLLELGVDVVEAAGLDAGVGGEGVAVHGVALPDHGAAVLGVLDGADVLGQEVADAGGAVAGYEGDLARLAGGVEGAEEGEDVGGRGRGADFYAEGCDETSVILVPEDEPESNVLESVLEVPEVSESIDLKPIDPTTEDIDNLMAKPTEGTSKAAVLEPIEGTGESFELWESSSAHDEADATS